MHRHKRISEPAGVLRSAAVLKGHDFSRAVSAVKPMRALAPEGKPIERIEFDLKFFFEQDLSRERIIPAGKRDKKDEETIRFACDWSFHDFCDERPCRA
jgi:hypothetical protein